jgi:hypothetical protein
MSLEAEIRAVCAARDAALVTNDAARIAQFMTDEWVYVGPDGPVPRADIIGWIASGGEVYVRADQPDGPWLCAFSQKCPVAPPPPG